MLGEYSALFYVGDEDTLEWVRPGAAVVNRADASDPSRIVRLTGASVGLTPSAFHMGVSFEPLTDTLVGLGIFVASFRLATDEEVSRYEARLRNPDPTEEQPQNEETEVYMGFPDDSMTPLSDDDLDRVYGFAMINPSYQPTSQEFRRALYELFRARGLHNEDLEQKADEGNEVSPRSSFSHLVDD